MRVSYENVTNLDRLIEAHPENAKVTLGSTQVTIEWDELQAGINYSLAITDAVAKINAMGKLHLTAQRIKYARAKLEAEADKINARLDDLDKKAPAAFANANSVVDSQHADVDGMDAEIRQLSNLGDA